MNSFFKLLVEKKFLFLPEKKKNIHFSEILGYLLPIGEKFYTRFKELLEEAIQQKGYNKLETSLFLSKAQVQNSGHLENFYEYSFFCPSCSMKEETTPCIHKKSKQKKGPSTDSVTLLCSCQRVGTWMIWRKRGVQARRRTSFWRGEGTNFPSVKKFVPRLYLWF